MEKIKTILIPYDFSKPSEQGLSYAINFAGKRPGTHLRICFIADQESEEKFKTTFESIKEGLSKAFRAKLSWTTLVPGSVKGLVQMSKDEQADMVIMGTSGSGDPEATTKTSEMVLSSECPVLVVPDGAVEEFNLSKIALILGQNEIDDPNNLFALLQVARSFDASVTVLTIENKPGTYGYSEEEERNEHLLEYYLESFYSHHTYIPSEDMVEGIFNYVDTHDIDMIVIFPRRHVKKGAPSEGKLTRILAQQSKTPLLAIEHE